MTFLPDVIPIGSSLGAGYHFAAKLVKSIPVRNVSLNGTHKSSTGAYAYVVGHSEISAKVKSWFQSFLAYVQRKCWLSIRFKQSLDQGLILA